MYYFMGKVTAKVTTVDDEQDDESLRQGLSLETRS